MELNQHLLANRQLRIERLLMPSCIVKPNERRRQIDEYKPFFAANLNRRRGTKRYGFSPHRRDICTTTDLRQDRVGIGLRIAEPETQDLIVGVGRAGPTQMPNRLDPIGLLINDVRAPIDQFEKLAIGLFLERNRVCRIGRFARQASVAKQQSWASEPRCNELLETQGRGRIAPRKSAHERNSGTGNRFLQTRRTHPLDVDLGTTENPLLGFASDPQGLKLIPVIFEHQDRFDRWVGNQTPKTVITYGIQFPCCRSSQRRHAVVNTDDPETISERTQRRKIPMLPIRT